MHVFYSVRSRTGAAAPTNRTDPLETTTTHRIRQARGTRRGRVHRSVVRTLAKMENGKKQVAESCFDFLFAAMIDALREGGGSSGGNGNSGDGSSEPRSEELLAETVRAIGFDVGYRLAESSAQARLLAGAGGAGGDGLLEVNVMKFICKEFWTEIFRKQIDKLQTNNQGVFVLRDAKFRWLLPFTADDEQTRRAAATVLNFPCGLIKGALENLGITSTVQAEVSPAVPSCSFTIKIKGRGSSGSGGGSQQQQPRA